MEFGSWYVLNRATPGLYQFECSSGMNRQEQRQAFTQAVPLLRSFGTAHPELGDFVFRDHALLRYRGISP